MEDSTEDGIEVLLYVVIDARAAAFSRMSLESV